MSGSDDMFVVPRQVHDALFIKAFKARGFTDDEALAAVNMAALATEHGVRTHAGLKALHLDDFLGSGVEGNQVRGCVPGAEVKKLPSRFKAVEKWDAQHKLGPAVAMEAMKRACQLADEYGTGTVCVDNAFHYLWGGGYVMNAAKQGYIAYTNCPAALTEVVPFGGRRPTLGTNPHSWGFPTVDAIGFPIVVDWATSTVAMGRVTQLAREGKSLPPESAVDKDGMPTLDPDNVAALLPFGRHKGYGLALLDELFAGYIGGGPPTLRHRTIVEGEKQCCTFFFQATHPDALDCGMFGKGRDQTDNIKTVLNDVLEGNPGVILPGQLEHEAAQRTKRNEGLLFSAAELTALADVAAKVGYPFDPKAFKPAVA
eukprot:m.86803 g.86803  ORF g.86803 m.86803 type:complete len:370 (-) comp9679_c1_seq1:186-1295(-)